jgi:nucleoside phosphorylase
MQLQNIMITFIRSLTFMLMFTFQVNASSIALFHALEEDLAALKIEGATQVRSFTVGDSSVIQLSLDGHAIYAVKMGSGCVQTCLSAQALLAKQKCDLAISIGPVGDISGRLDSTKWFRVSEVVSWQRGSQSEAGFQYHRDARILTAAPSAFKLSDANYDSLTTLSVASGEMFVASDTFRSELASRTKCDAVDMNLFGLLTVLKSHKVDGIHLRIPSDKADNKASQDFRRFTEEYKGEGGRIAAKIIRSLPEDKTSPDAHPSLRKILSGPQREEPPPQAPQSETEKAAPANSDDSRSRPAR